MHIGSWQTNMQITHEDKSLLQYAIVYAKYKY